MNSIINGVNHILNTGMLHSAYNGAKVMVEQASKAGNNNLEVTLNLGQGPAATAGGPGGLGISQTTTTSIGGAGNSLATTTGIGVKINTVA